MDGQLKKNILIFRTDRIGDLINTSPFLQSLKKYYKDSEIHLVCSNYNSSVAVNYPFIDKLIIYEKNKNFLNKIIFFFKILTKSFDICISIDGKKISKVISFFIRAKHKYIICYKKEKKILGKKFSISRPPLFICKFFYHTYLICDEDYNKINVNSDFNNHYLTMYYHLLKKNHVNLMPEKHVFIISKNSKTIFDNFYIKNIKKNFLNIHIDYKWDSYQINLERFNSMLKRIALKKNIVITSGKEGSLFFENLKKNFKSFSCENSDFFPKKNFTICSVLLIENLSINLLACLLEKSILHVSSHSGATFHISAAFNKPIIDFIKKNKESEYDRWIPQNTDYARADVNKLSDLESAINNKIKF